jgi:hypothetical protein
VYWILSAIIRPKCLRRIHWLKGMARHRRLKLKGWAVAQETRPSFSKSTRRAGNSFARIAVVSSALRRSSEGRQWRHSAHIGYRAKLSGDRFDMRGRANSPST